MKREKRNEKIRERGGEGHEKSRGDTVHAVIFICGHGNKENEGKADRLKDL